MQTKRKSIKTASPNADLAPIAFRPTRAVTVVVNGRKFSKTPQDHEEILLRSWLEYRKKRMFEFSITWEPKYFILLADSLIFTDSIETEEIVGKFMLLGATFLPWKEYKSDKYKPENQSPTAEATEEKKNGEEELSKEDDDSSTKKFKFVETEPVFERPEERILVFISADRSSTFYMKFMSSGERDFWLKSMQERRDKLMAKYVASEAESAIKISISSCKWDTLGEDVRVEMEAEFAGMKWQVERSYKEFQTNHAESVEKYICPVTTPPQLPLIPDEEDLQLFPIDLHEYVETLCKIEIVAQSPEFLNFLGVVSRPQASRSFDQARIDT